MGEKVRREEKKLALTKELVTLEHGQGDGDNPGSLSRGDHERVGLNVGLRMCKKGLKAPGCARRPAACACLDCEQTSSLSSIAHNYFKQFEPLPNDNNCDGGVH